MFPNKVYLVLVYLYYYHLNTVNVILYIEYLLKEKKWMSFDLTKIYKENTAYIKLRVLLSFRIIYW